MKKLTVFLYTTIIILSFTACSSQKEIGVNETNEAVTDISEKETEDTLVETEETDFTNIVETDYRNMEQNTNISLKVKEEVVTTDTAVITLIHENHSKKRYYMYDASHQLEKEVDGVWCEVPFRSDRNIAFGQSGIILPPKNEKNESIVNLVSMYKKLEVGKYRIIKTYTRLKKNEDSYAVAEFDVQ